MDSEGLGTRVVNAGPWIIPTSTPKKQEDKTSKPKRQQPKKPKKVVKKKPAKKPVKKTIRRKASPERVLPWK